MKILAGDIGGTKTLLTVGAWQDHHFHPICQSRYASAQFADLESIVDAFYAEHGHPTDIQSACFGVAGPIMRVGDYQTSRITNLPWQLDSRSLKEHCGVSQCVLVNDFEAIGYGIPALPPSAFITLQQGSPVAQDLCAVIGAGTGLGIALLVWQSEGYVPHGTEGGHREFSPISEDDIAFWHWMRKKHERITLERLLSGRGLTSLYEFFSEQQPEQASLSQKLLNQKDPAAAISQQALTQPDSLARKALNHFIGLYGSEAANLALTSIPRGGLYIAGGIAPKILPAIREGAFLKAFLNKGVMTELLRSIPIYIVLEEQSGLLGAAVVARNLLNL